LKLKKCELFQKEVEFVGRVVGPRGIYIEPGYIKDIKNWPRPKNKKEVERFLGFNNYHRAFIEEYTQMASCPCGSLKFISQVRLLWSVLTVKCLPNK
jgi:hypothetical protein